MENQAGQNFLLKPFIAGFRTEIQLARGRAAVTILSRFIRHIRRVFFFNLKIFIL